MEANDIAVRPAKRLITLADGFSFTYGSSDDSSTQQAARRAVFLCAPGTSTTLWPGDYIELELPQGLPPDSLYALEPPLRHSSGPPSEHFRAVAPPGIISSVAGRIRIPNLSGQPIQLKRHEHFCQVSPVFTPSTYEQPQHTAKLSKQSISLSPSSADTSFSSVVLVDLDNLLQPDMQSSFRSLLSDFDSVFDPTIQGYNGAIGPFEAKVTMDPFEPRAVFPSMRGINFTVYIQNKFDELEKLGVVKRPEDINVVVEYLNPSFLVKNSIGGYRLVTAFADVGRYSKPDIDSTLRQIAQWRHIITTDLTSAFYQFPLARESMKYCGVAIPFRGVGVYARSAMGMPGSVVLPVAIATLKSRIRSRRLSAREMWTQRDQFSNIQIPLSDYALISQQHSLREANHPSSEKSTAPLAQVTSSPSIAIGDLVVTETNLAGEIAT